MLHLGFLKQKTVTSIYNKTWKALAHISEVDKTIHPIKTDITNTITTCSHVTIKINLRQNI